MNKKRIIYVLVISLIILGLITLTQSANLKEAKQEHKKEIAYQLYEISSNFSEISELLALYQNDLTTLETELFNRYYLSRISSIMFLSSRLEVNHWDTLPNNFSLSLLRYKHEDSLIYFMNGFNDNLNEENAEVLSKFSSEVSKMFNDISRENFDVFYSGDYKYILEDIFNDIHNEINIIKSRLEE